MSDLFRKVVGNSTRVSFPELGYTDVPARIDTGARLSSIWASATERSDGTLAVTFFGAQSPFYKAEPVICTDFERLIVTSSMGQAQERYKVKILVGIRGKKVRASFTLADRSSQVYPVLIGRNILRGKFIVDVKVGKSLLQAEREHLQRLRAKLQPNDDQEEEE